jgi:hypothetical protein
MVLHFGILEHFILGWIEGKHLATVWTELLDKGWAHTFAQMVVGFIAFLPFFAFRETVTASYLPRCCHYLGKAWRCQSRRQINLVRGYA